MAPLNRDNCIRATTLLQSGKDQQYVANLLGVNQSTISRLARRLRETGDVRRRPGQGRKRKTSAIDDRFLTLSSLRDRTLSSIQLQNMLDATRFVQVSPTTVRRRLKEVNLRARRPARCPILLPRHRRARLDFCRQHENWGMGDWQRVIFTDECRVSVQGADGRQRVWRRPGERFADCAILERGRFGGGSVMIWGGISLNGRTDLVILGGPSLNAERYIEDILQDHVVPIAVGVGPNFLLMQDNARPHTAAVVTNFLDELGIHRLNWPACSPDLNPIEHLWDEIKRRLRKRRPPIVTLNQLRGALQDEWENIDEALIQTLIESMPRRIRAVIGARGGHTRY
jgi:transposase